MELLKPQSQSMIVTFIACPKAYTGAIAAIQQRAVRNWMAVAPGSEVLLFGDEDGTKDHAEECGARWVPDVALSPSGVPLFNSVAEQASKLARHSLHCYLNCDILLAPAFATISQTLLPHEFLGVGQRIDMGPGVFIDPTGPGAPARLRHESSKGTLTLKTPLAIDYFLFTAGLFANLDRLVIGRGGYDNALLAYCLRRGHPIVDLTRSVMALHQFHGYSHVANGRQTVFRGEDAISNMRLHDVRRSEPGVADADYTLSDGRLVKSLNRGDWLRHLEIQSKYVKGRPRLAAAARVLRLIRDRQSTHSRKQWNLDALLDLYCRTLDNFEALIADPTLSQ